MAIDILSIPPMSAESERVFSGARRTITWERHRLGAEVVEQSECLKSWIRLAIKDGGVINNQLAEQVLCGQVDVENVGGLVTEEALERLLDLGSSHAKLD